MRAPPAEVYEACGAKAEGASCSVRMHDREISGTCGKEPNGERLACRPEGGPERPGGGRGGPPGGGAPPPGGMR
jgi:hypothetical protein